MKRIRPKRRTVTENNVEGSWAISYGDMLTLLLAFFVLFFSIDQQEIQEELLQRSILATLSAKSFEKEHPEKFDDDVKESQFDYVGLEVKKMGKRVVVEFPDKSFFYSGQTELTKKGIKTLREFAEKFTPFAGKSLINVVGYTDDRPVKNPTWRYKDNLELSVLRAVSAQRVLQDAGIPIDRTRIGGFGVKELIEKEMPEEEVRLKRSYSRTIVLVIEPEKIL